MHFRIVLKSRRATFYGDKIGPAIATLTTMHGRIGALLILATPLLFADVTLRYSMDFKMGVSLPTGAGPQMPSGPSVLRIKGNKTQSTMGKYTVIGDLATNQTTWIDTENMKLAIGSVEDFFKALANATAARMPKISPQAQGIAQMFQGDVQTRKTGRTETIRGIRAEETALVYSISINQPVLNVPAGEPAMRMTMEIWRADADEVARNPALAELERYNIASSGLSGFDVSGFMRQLMAGFDQGLNGFQDALQGLLKQPGMQLRMHLEASSPMLAGTDPSQPVLSMTSELVELSTEPIDDSVFQIPSGYRRVELEEIVKDQFAAAGIRGR